MGTDPFYAGDGSAGILCEWHYKGDWLEAFLFGISIAVGLTPEMLPMIVTTCLAKGAVP